MGTSVEGRLARGAPLRPRDIDAESARACNAERARKARSDALLPHSHSLWLRAAAAGSHEPPPPSRFVPQAGPSLSPPARSRRRLARSRPRPASSRRRLAPRGACAPLASRSCRLPVLALDSARQAVSGAGIEPSHSSNHSAAGPSPAGVAGGPGGAAAPRLTTFPRRLTWPPYPDCAGRVVVLSPGARSPPPCSATCSAKNSTSSSRLGGVRGGRRGGQRGAAWGGGGVAAAAARCDRC